LGAIDTPIIAGSDRRRPSQWLRWRAMLGLGRTTVE